MKLPASNQEALRLLGIGRLFQLTYEAVVCAELESETVMAWNPAAERLFGYSPAEAIGMPLDVLVAPELRDAHRSGIQRFRETGVGVLVGAAPVEVPAVTKEGRRLTVALSLTAVPIPGEHPAVVAVIRDVTAQKQAELDLVRANETMQDFVATASHELRTPLTAVIGFGELVKERAVELNDSESIEFAEVIVRAAGRASRLVDNLLTLSKIQAHIVEACPTQLTLGSIVPEVLQDGAAAADIEADIAPELSVFADRDHVVRILSNLITNAVKYGRDPITLSAHSDGEQVEIRIRDRGPGVPADFIDRLFDRFARAGSVRQSDGTGLGLSIVRGLARANRGDAFYEAADDGSVFGVRLPVRP